MDLILNKVANIVSYGGYSIKLNENGGILCMQNNYLVEICHDNNEGWSYFGLSAEQILQTRFGATEDGVLFSILAAINENCVLLTGNKKAKEIIIDFYKKHSAGRESLLYVDWGKLKNLNFSDFILQISKIEILCLIKANTELEKTAIKLLKKIKKLRIKQ